MIYRVEFVSSAAKSYSRLDPVLQRRDPPADPQPGGRQRPRSRRINHDLARRLNRRIKSQLSVAAQLPRQDLRLPAAIAREAHLHDNQTLALKVIPEGVLIRPVQPRLSLAERLAAYGAIPGEPTEAY